MIIFEIELVQPPSKVFVLLGASSQKSKWWDLETFHMPETWLVVVSLPVSYVSVEPTRKVWFQNIMIFHWGCGFMLVKNRCEDLWCLMKPCHFFNFLQNTVSRYCQTMTLGTEVVTKRPMQRLLLFERGLSRESIIPNATFGQALCTMAKKSSFKLREDLFKQPHVGGLGTGIHLYYVGGKRVCFKIRGAWIHRVSCFYFEFSSIISCGMDCL